MTESSSSAPGPCSLRPVRRRSGVRRWTWRAVKILTISYLVACLCLDLGQNLLIFPGAYVHGREEARVEPAPGREVLTLRSAQGKHVAAIFGPALFPDGSPRPDAVSRPTILYFYGNGDCVATSLWQFEDFRRLGANVMIPEYIGYPMSGGKPNEAHLYDTANAAYAYLLTRKDVDPRRIVIVGRSLGCAPAIDLASRERVSGLATFSAFTSMDDMARKVAPIFPTSLFLHSHFDNARKIALVKCPIFLAHGTRDDFVPFKMMALLAASSKRPVAVYQIRGATHNDIFAIGGQALLARLGQFLDSLEPSPGQGALAPAQP